MVEQRLYIDDQLVDIDNDTKLTLNIKSNLFQDVSKFVSNSTFSVKLPKTVRNQRIFEHADKVQNGGGAFPYKLHTARYFRNGVQLIDNGRAVCLSVGESIEISIVWGLYPAFTNIQSKGTTLNQLKSSARLKWAASEYNTYDEALAAGYFYGEYNPFHLAETGGEWTGSDTPEGTMSTTILWLDNGAIETGETVGATISPAMDVEQSTYAAVIANFKVGETLKIRGAVGGDTKYRLYAVLDSANKVLELGDASTADTAAGDYSITAPANASRVIVNLLRARSQGYQVVIAKGANSTQQARAMARTTSTTSGTGFIGGRGYTRGGNANPYVHPSVLVSWVLNLIWEQTGIQFKWTGEAADVINTLAIPLINNKSTSLTLDGMLDAVLVARTGNGALKVKLNSASTLFSNTVGVEADELVVVSSAAVYMDVQGHWDWDASGSRPQGSTTMYIDGVPVTTYQYIYQRNYIEMKITPRVVTEDDDVATYIVGDASQSEKGRSNFDTSDNLVNNRFYRLVSGYGKIELQAGDKITFEMKNARGSLHDVKFSGGTIKGTLDAGDTVPRGGYFPIAYNLPAIKIVDFVKFLAAITGTFPLQMDDDNAVQFVPFATIWDNIPNAKDWTRRVVAQSLSNKPKELEFKIGDYAQLNQYKWKEDDTVFGNYDGTLAIDNKTLDDSKVIITFPFAATDGSRVPTYTAITYGVTFGERRGATRFASGTTNGGQYKACKERILQLYKGADDRATLKFELDMDKILKTKYRKLKESLQAAKVIKERVMLADVDLLNFDERVPVYIAQYGAFFAVTEIKQADTGTADVTMFQIKEEHKVFTPPKDIKITVTATHTASGYVFVWKADAELGSTIYLNIASETGDVDIEGIELLEGETGGTINTVMSSEKPIDADVLKMDKEDKNTYTAELVYANVITVTLEMGSETSHLFFRASEALTSPITVFVVVFGNNQHPTTVTIPAGAESGLIQTDDGYPFSGLIYVSSDCTKADSDTNEYIISKA